MKRMSHGEARRQAVALWRGPELMEGPENEERFLYGHQLLRLGMETQGPNCLQSRSLYMIAQDANERADGEDGQEIAVLRGMYWKSGAAYGQITERHADGTLTVRTSGPRMLTEDVRVLIRYVEVPVAQGNAWIQQFDALALVFHTYYQHDDQDADVARSLMVEWQNRMELRWNTRTDATADLRTRWQAVWDEMGAALAANPIFTGGREYFAGVDFAPDTDLYDFTQFPFTSD